MSDLAFWLAQLCSALVAVLALALLFRMARGAGREVREELRVGREEARGAAKELREEVASGLRTSSDTLIRAIEGMGKIQLAQLQELMKQLGELADYNHTALDRIRGTLDLRIKELLETNERKLGEIQRTVDDKLQDTLERRLGESFKLVSERLEAVHKGLGEMQVLAAGVGDLKRVLSNVKVRGTWAEVQLGAILEQMLAPDQYAKNVAVTPNARERVEYAVRLPGPQRAQGSCVWLPIDSKFPQEDYLRLQEAAEKGNPDALREAADNLIRTVRTAAKDIHDKYISPPSTTDFAIMFLGTEGLYAEVLRQAGLVEDLQQRYRVVVAGPTTLAAILSSLRMGFQTLAIEQRAEEVWKVLGAVKTEFTKFSQLLEKVKRQIEAASKTLDATGARSNAIQRRLRAVEQLPQGEVSDVLELPKAHEEVLSEEGVHGADGDV